MRSRHRGDRRWRLSRRHLRDGAALTAAIHDDEVETSEAVVRWLLDEQCPGLARWSLTSLSTSGTTNALWRINTPQGRPDLLVRLPRLAGGDDGILTEFELLPALAETDLTDRIKLPTIFHRGQPGHAFPMHWMIVEWIDGDDAWFATDRSAELPIDLAETIRHIRQLDNLPVPVREPGQRGGPLAPLLQGLDEWLHDPVWEADRLVDVARVRAVMAQCAEVATDRFDVGFVHGDLIPGNVLLNNGRLAALIDWGGAGRGDLAQDLAPAWALFEDQERDRFRRELEVDDATWLRARAIELQHAVGGVLYYRPRGHLLGEVMARTLDRLLTDPISTG